MNVNEVLSKNVALHVYDTKHLLEISVSYHHTKPLTNICNIDWDIDIDRWLRYIIIIIII